MSILDGMPSSTEELMATFQTAGALVNQILGELKLEPKEQSVIDLMNNGHSLATIFDITKQERDALFVKGCRLIQIGQTKRARDFLTVLYQLEPLDERVIYALASTFQIEGDMSRAAKLYIFFLALDASNAEGWLRLGECLKAAEENDQALECFQIAHNECARGNGSERAANYAAKTIADIQSQAIQPLEGTAGLKQ